MTRVLRYGALLLVAVVLAIQLVPYGRDHSNPPVVEDAPWADASVRELAVAACYDCHSHETEWPVYSWVAPMSWLVTRDVESGREELNFSTWPNAGEIRDAAEVVVDGSMPPRRYRLAHPDARLTADERQRLIDALIALGAEPDD